MKISSLIALLTILLIIACSKHRLFDRVDQLPSGGWIADQVLRFNVPLSDTSKSYDISFHLRNYTSYEFSNLWLFVNVEAPNGNILRDTFEIVVADESGKWLGKGLGDINSILVPFRRGIRFPYSGIYKFSVEQAMRRDTLENVIDFGLRVEESGL